jgi:hypothetical protein
MEEHMLDLLCKKAVYGLDESEERKLLELEGSTGLDFDAESFELTAAAISTYGLDTDPELPANLRARIAADAERFFDAREASESAAVNGHAVAAEAGVTKGFSLPSWLGWAVAAAACIMLAINLYTTRQANIEQAQNPPQNRHDTDVRKLTPAQLRAQLIETAPDLTRAAVAAGNMKNLQPFGDVVWSDAKQAGFVRLTGLPVNDAGRGTYQLWIMAENQDPKTPVDGGVFNVTSDGEVIVPIDPRVKVSSPKAFAITIEKPGGVVVSKQEKVAALAKSETQNPPSA